MTPGKLDSFDDHRAVVANARLAGMLARQAACDGILLDTEQYEGQLFDYAKQRDAARRSWLDYAFQARRRGKEVMAAIQESFPDLTVMLTFGPSLLCGHPPDVFVPREVHRYGLLVPFVDGLIDATKGKTRIVDGFEQSYGYREAASFKKARELITNKAAPQMANPPAYRRVISAGFGVWLDYDWRKRGWKPEMPETNYFSPSGFTTPCVGTSLVGRVRLDLHRETALVVRRRKAGRLARHLRSEHSAGARRIAKTEHSGHVGRPGDSRPLDLGGRPLEPGRFPLTLLQAEGPGGPRGAIPWSHPASTPALDALSRKPGEFWGGRNVGSSSRLDELSLPEYPRLPLGSVLLAREFGNGRVGFLEHNHPGVEVHGVNLRLEPTGKCRVPGQRSVRPGLVVLIEVVSQAGNVIDHGVALDSDVFAEIDPAEAEMGEQLLEGNDLVLGDVAAVIDHDVERRDLVAKRPERSIGLIAHENGGALVLVAPAILGNIDAVDPAARPEVLFPHAETSAAVHADFQDVDLTSHELGKVAVVDLEIVPGLPDAWAFQVRIEVLLQRIWLATGRARGGWDGLAHPLAGNRGLPSLERTQPIQSLAVDANDATNGGRYKLLQEPLHEVFSASSVLGMKTVARPPGQVGRTPDPW